MQIQKAGTPIEGRHSVQTPEDLEKAKQIMKDQPPNAVVLERSNADAIDLNEQLLSGLRDFTSKIDSSAANVVTQDFLNSDTKVEARKINSQEKARSFLSAATYFHIFQVLVPYIEKEAFEQLACCSSGFANLEFFTGADGTFWNTHKQTLLDFFTSNKAYLHQFILATGNGMMNQFEPWYFGVAFAFCFKFCSGMPDLPSWSKHPKHRRHEEDPEVDLATWIHTISRRPELQVKHNWQLGFTMGSVLFRSMVNRARALYAFSTQTRSDGRRALCHFFLLWTVFLFLECVFLHQILYAYM